MRTSKGERIYCLSFFGFLALMLLGYFYYFICGIVLSIVNSNHPYVQAIVYLSVAFLFYILVSVYIFRLYYKLNKHKDDYDKLSSAISIERDSLKTEMGKVLDKKNEYEALIAKCAADSLLYKNNLDSEYNKHQQNLNDEYDSKAKQLQNDYNKAKKELEDHFNAKYATEKEAIQSKLQSYPFLADLLSTYYKEEAERAAQELIYKRHPAYNAADKVRGYAHDLKQWVNRAKLAENQLLVYESLFPWLEEFKEVPPLDAHDIVNNTSFEDSEYSHYKSWISPEEYASLTQTERNQLALDRYKKRPKTNWEIGIEYERYIGYIYELRGFRVTYTGATEGLEDMGRDLIAQDGKKVYVIQCKRWAKEKTIHEKHIFQLYGTTVLYRLDHPSSNVLPLFVTTTDLSPMALRVAQFLDITIVSSYSPQEYPMIKCNVGKDGEKIYHLPFDQQYDSIVISPDKGEGYAYTVAEAEGKGFRHAYRWHG